MEPNRRRRYSRFNTEIGHRITVLLAEAGMTQCELARVIGVSRGHLSQMLNGRARPWSTLELLVRDVLANRKTV